MSEGRFKKWLGKTEVEIEGDKYELDIKIADVEGIVAAYTAMKDPSKTKESFAKVSEVLMEVFKRSYKDEPKEDIEAFLSKNYLPLLEKVTIAFGLVKGDAVSKFRGEALTPGN